jgi:hypothetical protein
LLLLLTCAGVSLGLWTIWWARASRHPVQAAWGRGLFVCILVCLGVAGLVAAGLRTAALAPLGLCAGLLVVGMLWEPASPPHGVDLDTLPHGWDRFTK